jgi:hypothetical protein
VVLPDPESPTMPSITGRGISGHLPLKDSNRSGS